MPDFKDKPIAPNVKGNFDAGVTKANEGQGQVDKQAGSDAWAKRNNQVGWEKEALKTDDPNAT